MLHAPGQERILLSNDLAGNLQDRARTLIQALGQPVCGLEAFAQEALLALAARLTADGGIIGLIHQHPWQRVAVEFDRPAAIAGRPHQHIRHHRLDQRCAEGTSRLRVERPDFGDHLRKILVVHGAGCAQPRIVVACKQFDVLDQPGHRRIVAVPVDQLQLEAFGERPCKNARGFERLEGRKHGIQAVPLDAHMLRRLGQIEAQIAGLVEIVDQRAGDQPVDGVGHHKHHLIRQMLLQRHLGRDECLQVVVVAAPAARPARSPEPALKGVALQGLPRGATVFLAGARARIIRVDIAEIGVEASRDFLRAVGKLGADPLAVGLTCPFRGRCIRRGGLRRIRGLALALDALQQRIALHFRLDITRQVETRHLQKLDRLHQLRRHDQGLALTDFKLRRQGHSDPRYAFQERDPARQAGTGSACFPVGPLLAL